MKLRIVIILLVAIIVSCGNKKDDATKTQQNQQQPPTQNKKESVNSDMKITSSSFKEGDLIPSKYTCDGDNVSPQLSWVGAPENTKSFAVISDDPDAPAGIWVHWVIFNIPSGVNELSENLPKDKNLENKAIQGVNDFGNNGYDGPCPPGGTHRYYFKLYALDAQLSKEKNMTKAQLLKSMEGHILGQAEIMGKYKRN